ncbi:WecB/TagA/CpsF family glycosyltransferase [Candidatus Collierbacteria bacterium]|nr:WecB/TagA/CpsF family glycosyltransferase [Candidatus Collierbacteria bacterium]
MMNNMRKQVLGVVVDFISRSDALKFVSQAVGSNQQEMKLIVTAYSEFFVRVRQDGQFKSVLNQASLVLPDGIGPVAAIKYKEELVADGLLARLMTGFKVGKQVLTGRVGETVPGVWLFEELISLAAKRRWKVYLLGGFGETAEKLGQELRIKNKDLRIKTNPGAQNTSEMTGEFDKRVIEEINDFEPDLLFVAYGPVRQEKWLFKRRRQLKVKVALGVGGTFDEVLGLVKRAPGSWENAGLKWLWRLFQQPGRLRRIWRAVVIFSWLVFSKEHASGSSD